jgi:hypothetical protein
VNVALPQRFPEALDFDALFSDCFRQSGWLLGDFLEHQGHVDFLSSFRVGLSSVWRPTKRAVAPSKPDSGLPLYSSSISGK